MGVGHTDHDDIAGLKDCLNVETVAKFQRELVVLFAAAQVALELDRCLYETVLIPERR
jgi:hypothetical protein